MRKPYPSDLSDEQWAIIEPLIPVNTTGRPREVDMREVLRADGTWQSILDALRREVRTAGGHDPSPSVASIDSQTVKATEVADSRGYDGGKKISGRKRHIIVDRLGLLPGPARIFMSIT